MRVDRLFPQMYDPRTHTNEATSQIYFSATKTTVTFRSFAPLRGPRASIFSLSIVFPSGKRNSLPVPVAFPSTTPPVIFKEMPLLRSEGADHFPSANNCISDTKVNSAFPSSFKLITTEVILCDSLSATVIVPSPFADPLNDLIRESSIRAGDCQQTKRTSTSELRSFGFIFHHLWPRA